MAEGTSSAAALVAGVAALIKARYPDLRPAEVAQALAVERHGRPAAGYDDQVGFGVVDAVAAMNAAERLAGEKRSLPVPDERHFGQGRTRRRRPRPVPIPGGCGCTAAEF